jgi:putative alpha-1,2-mannosidase
MVMPFDPAGLIRQLGGNEATVVRLDEFFREVNAGQNRPYAWIGNEPSLNAPWAYNFAGAPAKTQALVRRIELELFDTTPGGLPGNDDGGTTSAWYVLAALGLYPTTPGTDRLAIGSPLFQDAVLRLSTDRTVHIIGRGAADDAPYVRSLLLDGATFDAAFIDWARLSPGATLEFELATAPT